MEKILKTNGVLRGNCYEAGHNIPRKDLWMSLLWRIF